MYIFLRSPARLASRPLCRIIRLPQGRVQTRTSARNNLRYSFHQQCKMNDRLEASCVASSCHGFSFEPALCVRKNDPFTLSLASHHLHSSRQNRYPFWPYYRSARCITNTRTLGQDWIRLWNTNNGPRLAQDEAGLPIRPSTRDVDSSGARSVSLHAPRLLVTSCHETLPTILPTTM